MGEDYEQQIYFSLRTGEQVTRETEIYDLAFTNAPHAPGVWLNSAKLMRAAPTDASFEQSIDPKDFSTVPDNANWNPDTAAVIQVQSLPSKVYLIERGPLFYAPDQSYFKLQVMAITDDAYTIRVAPPDAGTGETLTIPRNDSQYSCTYWHLDNGLTDVAPPDANWDLLFTRYYHTYDSLPDGDPFKYYGVTGALSNTWKNVQVKAISGEQAETKPYANADSLDWSAANWSPHANTIGFDWKIYDFEAGFIVRTDVYYLIRLAEGSIYKLKFTGFLNEAGVKGHPAFLYKRIQ